MTDRQATYPFENTRERGRFGEQIAVDFLVERGYAIRERNWQAEHKEVDIIAQRDDEFIFVEVKMRADRDYDFNSIITEEKKLNLREAARAYRSRSPRYFKNRFDVIFVIGNEFRHVIHHYHRAFPEKNPPHRKSFSYGRVL